MFNFIKNKFCHSKSYTEWGVYPSITWIPEEDYKIFELEPASVAKGTILGEAYGKVCCLPENTKQNKHMAVFGGPGTGKSRCFVINQILQCARRGESIIMTDFKGEYYAMAAEYLQSMGYEVKMYDTINQRHSNSWNCLNEIKGNQHRAQIIADIIMKNPPNSKVDKFWIEYGGSLLEALLLFVSMNENYTEEQKNLAKVYDLLTESSKEDIENLFDILPDGHPAKTPYNIYKKGKGNNDQITNAILRELTEHLRILQSQAICSITSTNEIDLELPAKKKCAYFVTTSYIDSTPELLSSLYINFLVLDIIHYAEAYGKNGQCDVPVNFILDEFQSIGQIQELPKKLTNNKGINVDIICQNISQLENMYSDGIWKEILDCCDTQLFLECRDNQTVNYISKELMDIGSKSNSRRTIDEYKRSFLDEDEIRFLRNTQAIVFINNEKMRIVNKFDCSKHPDYKKLHHAIKGE